MIVDILGLDILWRILALIYGVPIGYLDSISMLSGFIPMHSGKTLMYHFVIKACSAQKQLKSRDKYQNVI